MALHVAEGEERLQGTATETVSARAVLVESSGSRGDYFTAMGENPHTLSGGVEEKRGRRAV